MSTALKEETYELLDYIIHLEEPLTVSELALCLDISKQAATTSVTTLVNRGFAERLEAEEMREDSDRFVTITLIVPTAAGKAYKHESALAIDAKK